MKMMEEIQKTESAIDAIIDFFQNHYDRIDQTTIKGWTEARKGIVEELYYMRRAVDEARENEIISFKKGE